MTSSPSHMWKPPSRSSSINSLASTYSQVPSLQNLLHAMYKFFYNLHTFTIELSEP